MDRSDIAGIVSSDMTVSDKIRALAAGGYPRAEIARLLGKRYQHVRNVLEADKLRPPNDRDMAPNAGVAESPRAFGGTHRLSVEPGGLVRLPPALLEALQARPGSVVIAEPQDDGVKLFSNAAAWARVRAMVKEFGIDPNRDLVAELIAERRTEAERDD